MNKIERPDVDYLRLALGLARRGLGNVWPNPAVGCLIVGDGRIVGRGWTQPGGRPHAEAMALDQAGAAANGATAYVTFEPCAHHGETPPCAEALARAGIGQVVFAAPDPDPRVDGSGEQILRDAGVSVKAGELRAEAEAVNAGFISRVVAGRPLVTLKFATTLDGRIATRTGDSQWITGPAARMRSHLLRARHDAVLVGINTALTDDPELTCRLPGMGGRSPVRVVLDSGRRLPAEGKLARSATKAPLWLVACAGAGVRADLDPAIDQLEVAADADGRVDITAALDHLASRGITRLLVEGGAGVATSLLTAGLADRLAWFRAPSLIGADGLSVTGALGVEAIEQLRRFQRVAVERIGDDVLESYAVRA
ncbi:MAG: bifunctional diaminohydroxyphosphoribosylaminopyrimidine deaminase/5-amino-6-(5-phosphoribosylamino)uracil reductase RibD [Alphaproteobacteria bacterium]|nr:bifunctional diaminohydroxyphosphoribosylaminopyrimidine deaminase/5-amino-6-(5-phosphoribosylamino)uracil reductase RibD [Alphaproteobacteria bacterium]MDP6565487.1 bifunctional diaminohydroxyphosphoribosylaminopyrimidine deaminase/5-amino-6-(5-phosphoribosylamino)uracil reductase RibD [Alphaproteobacteria bacterium]